MNIEEIIKEHIELFGSINCSKSLGIVQLPENTAIMLNSDRSHYYGLASDDSESSQSWNKWDIYYWYKKKAKELREKRDFQMKELYKKYFEKEKASKENGKNSEEVKK